MNDDALPDIVTSDRANVIMYDADTREELSRLHHRAQGTDYSVVFDPHESLSEDRMHRHASDVYAVAFSPAGDLVASGSHEGVVRLWDVRSGEELNAIWLGAPILGMSFRPADSSIAVHLHQQGVAVWDFEAEQQLAGNMVALIGHRGPLRQVAFSRDGRQIVSASFDKTIRFWNVETGHYYICNCCGCCCGVLRSINELGINASDVINSYYYAQIDEDVCVACGTCKDERCQVNAIEEGDDAYRVIQEKCIGCGLCVTTCPSEAMKLVRKQPQDIVSPPKNEMDWFEKRGNERGVDFSAYK